MILTTISYMKTLTEDEFIEGLKREYAAKQPTTVTYSKDRVKKLLAYAITRIEHPFVKQAPFAANEATSTDILERAARWQEELKEYEEFKAEVASIWKEVADGVALARDEKTGIDIVLSTEGGQDSDMIEDEYEDNPRVAIPTDYLGGEPKPRGVLKVKAIWPKKRRTNS